jgi:DNA-binding response OmpR family regulator
MRQSALHAAEGIMRPKVVIVEDDADILEVLVEMLEDGGFQPIPFRDARTALEYTMRRPPALIITDLVMAGMSGEQFIRSVRERCEARIPILVTSASSNMSALASLPIQGYVGKPFDFGELLEAARRCVADAPPALQAATPQASAG